MRVKRLGTLIALAAMLAACSKDKPTEPVEPTKPPSNGKTGVFYPPSNANLPVPDCTKEAADAYCYRLGYQKEISHICAQPSNKIVQIICWKP